MQTCSGSLLVWILAEINDDTHLQGFFQSRAGLRLAPSPPWICWEFYFTCKSIINDTINGKLCLCKNSPRFHQIASNKRSKFKISQGSMPPSLPHALHMDTYLPPPIGQKAERNPAVACMRSSVVVWFHSLHVCSPHTPEGINLQHFKSREACNALPNLYSEAISLITYACK